MNKLLLVALFAIVATAMAGSYAEDHFLFQKFQAFHGKQYRVDQVDLRFNIFRNNLKFIEAHNEKYNRGESTFHLGLTKFADLTNAEYKKIVLGASKLEFPGSSGVAPLYTPSKQALPDSVDWRQKGVVTRVKNQGQCGSCWSFSATGSMEGAHALATGNLIELSEQQLVDCVNGGANTCDLGGWMTDAFSYAIKNGMETEQEYPYLATSGHQCGYRQGEVKAHITGYQNVTSGSESDLQNALANYPTVSVAIDASSMWFQMYSGGVYDDASCKNGLDDLDHGVLAVGYGTLDGKDYWIVKNSWGPEWGLSGYILMSRNNNNQCGISTAASFPTTN